MSIDDKDTVFSTFFDNVINAKDHETLKAWLAKQSLDDMKYFLYTFKGWHNEGGKQSLLRLEIENRTSKSNSHQRWADRAIGGVGTIILTLLGVFLEKMIK